MQEATQQNPSPQQDWQHTYLNLKELCQYLHVSPSTVERMMREGLIRGYRIYRQNILFKRAEIDEYIEHHPIEEERRLARRPPLSRKMNRNQSVP